MEINYRYVTKEDTRLLQLLRRDFHQYPEQGFAEYRTSGEIAKLLEAYGYEVHMGAEVCKRESRMGVPSDEYLAECEKRALSEGLSEEYLEKMQNGMTGVVGILKGAMPGATVALRYDIDALPITEMTGADYASKHIDTMHACGHDGHISCGLVVAKLLAENKDKLCGEIRIIFQPGEEGCKGSQSIVDNGWLDNVDVFLSGHVGLGCTELGQIYACNGGFLATTKMDITFKGVCAHAAKVPELGRNALLAAAVFTENVYAISRNGMGDTRINVGRFVSGTGRNIIADSAFLEIETRGSNTETNEYMEKHVFDIAAGVEKMYGVTCDVKKVGSSGSGSCSEVIVDRLKPVAQSMSTEIEYSADGYMGASEDVVAMMNYVQKNGGVAAYYMFGTKLAAGHHQDTFDFDEEVLPIMTEFYARSVIDVYSNKER